MHFVKKPSSLLRYNKICYTFYATPLTEPIYPNSQFHYRQEATNSSTERSDKFRLSEFAEKYFGHRKVRTHHSLFSSNSLLGRIHMR